MPQIICLANSWKFEERCIAGIDIQTGQWVRPISNLYPDDGRVPAEVRLIEGREPALLDILEIPLEASGPDFGFECENRTIASGEWQYIGQAKPEDLLQYCENQRSILHTSDKYVTVSYLQSLPFNERRTLQLVYAREFIAQETLKARGRKWQGTIVTLDGQRLSNVTITDPACVNRLEYGYVPQNPCLVTMSLSLPYRPSDDWEEAPCWKLIAGVIELGNYDLVMVEMRRLRWSIEQGRNYLQQCYDKRSRQQLTAQEMADFLNYLKSLPTPS